MIAITVIVVLFNCLFDQSIDKSLMTNASPLLLCPSVDHIRTNDIHSKEKQIRLDEISSTDM